MDKVKIVKCIISKNTDIKPPYRLILKSFTSVYLVGDDNVELPIQENKDLYIHILRESYSPSPYSYKITKTPDGLLFKLYVSQSYINTICEKKHMVPYVIKYILDTCKCAKNANLLVDNSIIPIAENVDINADIDYMNITLHPYQKNNVFWLSQIEKNISLNKNSLEYLILNKLDYIQTSKIKLYSNSEEDVLYNEETIWDCSESKIFSLYGGVLCDDVGLGKTLSMTTLIVQDKITRENTPIIGKIPKVKVTLTDTATKKMVVKIKPKLKQPIDEIKEPIEEEASVDEVSDTSIGKKAVRGQVIIHNREILIETNATLVMCPRRLVGQWVSEIQKYTGMLKVVELSTMVHINKYVYSDMKKYDVAVVSFSLLDNKNYLSQETFLLDCIKWRRLIIDEGHEVLLHKTKKLVADLRVSSAIFSIKSVYRWVCTGTPLASTEASLQAILSFLGGLGHNELSPILENINKEQFDTLIGMIFHRNTKKSVEKQIFIPNIENHVDLLDFTSTENAMYKAINESDTLRRLQICTNINISDKDSAILGGIVLSMDQVNKAMGTHYQLTCDTIKQDIETCVEKIGELETTRDEELDEMTMMVTDLESSLKISKGEAKATIAETLQELKEKRTKTGASYRGKIKTQNERIIKLQEDLVETRKQLQIFRSLDMTHIRHSKCPILGTDLSKDTVVITASGYYYSQTGMELLFTGGKKTVRCPCTGEMLNKANFIVVNTKAGSETEQNIDIRRNKWGSKMALVIDKLNTILKDNDSDRVIIFSTWDKMLTLVGHALTDCGIKHVFCRGNVHMMSKSIRTFKTDNSYKVILLSSDKCSSGTNLTEASHVFLLDSISESAESSKANEIQAIGRAARLGQKKTVHVYKFVVRDTIEYDYYTKLDTKN